MSYRKRNYKPPLITLAVLTAAAVGVVALSLRGAPAETPVDAAPALMEEVSAAPASAAVSTAEPTLSPTAEPTADPVGPVFSEYPDLGKPVKLTREEAIDRLYRLAPQDWRLIEILNHKEAYSDDTLKALGNNLELLDFICSYDSAEKTANGGFTEAELAAPHPRLMQWDSRWGYVNYGSGPIGVTGCGPTCLSMVALSLTGNADATPDAIAADSLKCGFYTPGAGSTWTLISEGCADFGLIARELPLWEDKMKDALDTGEQIICCVGPGDFTLSGHFIVVYDYTEEGFRVNDPNSNLRSEKIWPYSVLQAQISNLWALSAADETKTAVRKSD